MWLLGRLIPDHKTIADFRKDKGAALRQVCARFVELCRRMGLLTTTSVAIDGSKFKAVNNRDKNFTRAKVERRRKQLEESVARYLSQLDTADRQEPTEALVVKTTRLNEKLAKLKEEIGKLAAYEKAFVERVAERALAMEGTCTGEHGIGQGKKHFLVPEHGSAAVEAMGAIKLALDPGGIMNPGKIV